MLQSQGEHAKALDLLSQNLATSSKHLSENDSTVLSDRDRLSQCLRVLGDYEGAVELDEATLSLRKRIHIYAPETIATQHNLAENLNSLGQHERAIPLYQSALSARERTLGPRHSLTLQTKHNFALSLFRAGQIREASMINEQVLKVREKYLAADNSDLVSSIHNLSLYSYALGDLERAYQLTNRNLQALHGIRAPTDNDLRQVISLKNQIESAVTQDQWARAIASRNHTIVSQKQDYDAASARVSHNINISEKLKRDKST